MAGKASLTNNPLARPESPIHWLAAQVQNYLHFPDPTPLYAVMGVLAANLLEGDPVWLMIIGPPASGKTELLNSLMSIARMHVVSTIKGPAALLSGVAKKDYSTGATGGLLRQVGTTGGLICKDFTSILSLPHEPLTELISAFRDVYDGHWTRVIGSEGGTSLTWEGKIAFFAACTNVIDRYHSISNSMGERWIYYRYPESDGYGECKRVLSIANPSLARSEFKELVKSFFEILDMDWGTPKPKREFTDDEWSRLISLAMISARCRSAVVRHNYSREVEEVSEAELPTRICAVLGQLYLGLEFLGLEEEERWRVVCKIALDCMPNIRRKTLEIIRANGARHVDSTLEDIRAKLQCSLSTVKRTVEDLQIHGVLSRAADKKLWSVSDWAQTEIDRGWGVTA